MGPQSAAEATPAATFTDGKTADGTRARELYKYFQPPRPTHTVSVSRSAPPDTVLTAHAQLVAWRLDVQRALISLIDRDTQYFVAESTKTLNLANSEECDEPSDGIWAGCINVPKAGRLCEHTIQQFPTSDGRPACFEVLDLVQDDRFNTLPFVVGEPHFRYYVGVPLRTKKGIAIGSLFAMDDKVREPVTESCKNFLTTMASNVMEHLELMKEKADRMRAVNMNMCLAAFVDPEHQLRRRKRAASHQTLRGNATFGEHKAARSVKDERSESIASPRLPSPKSPPKSNGARSTTSKRPERARSPREDDSDDSVDDSDADRNSRVGDDDRLEALDRAAKLFRESLSLEGGGGVVFMDTMPGLRSDRTSVPSGKPSVDDMKANRDPLADVNANTPTSYSSSPSAVFREIGQTVEIMSFSETPKEDNAESDHGKSSFIPLTPSDLAKLIRRNPRGKLYSFGDDGLSQGSSGDEALQKEYYGMPDTRRRVPSKSEAGILSRHFPGARQVIFVPLWDITLSRWGACFAYNTSDFRTFSHNPDFLHSIAFCNCLMTEIARLATIAADQQKSDFIGSISHELRSPLHGILASCEFLEDTDCSSYQKALVATADSCARTLLDTINMVLDYSKINSFERNIRKARKSRKDMPTSAATIPIMQQPSFNIYDTIDLAAITEEVVEGVALGHMFKDITTFDGSIESIRSQPTPPIRDDSMATRLPMKRPPVEILLDMEARRWNFITQPGAFRRVVMNLFGNALKYTKKGFIKVKLEAKDFTDPHAVKPDCNQDPLVSSIVTLTISDSGQGISPEYMRTKLFTPFAQESPLNPGTGLGLSLVRSIVEMLNGEINIRSALGVGTEVVVTLPMVKGSPAGSTSTTPASGPASAGSAIERPVDNTLSVVRQMTSGLTAALYRPADYASRPNSPTIEVLDAVNDAANTCFKDWCGLANVVDWSPDQRADIIAIDEVDLPSLLQAHPHVLGGHADGPILMVARATATKNAATDDLLKAVHTEYFSRPIGPYKLARALRNVLERRAKAVTSNGPAVDGMTRVENAAMHMTLPGDGDGAATIAIVQQGKVLGNEESMNAQMAMDTLPPPEQAAPMEQQEEFPFPDPSPDDDGMASPSFLPPHGRPPLDHSRTMSWTPREVLANEQPAASPMSVQGVALNTAKTVLADVTNIGSPSTPTPAPAPTSTAAPSDDAATPKPPAPRTPRLLVVDDNKVNLRLLQTFMRKRAYATVSSAEDGAQAVAVYSALVAAVPPAPPEIIFMDISMPVMNGFEATRRIRDAEARWMASLPPLARPPPSLIVALTGLASGRDQSEAFTSGFDLYMTKPVSFREVGRLLDNWVANGGVEKEEVPHGPVAGMVG